MHGDTLGQQEWTAAFALAVLLPLTPHSQLNVEEQHNVSGRPIAHLDTGLQLGCKALAHKST